MEISPYHNINLAKAYLDIMYLFITIKTVATGDYERDLAPLSIKTQTVPLKHGTTKIVSIASVQTSFIYKKN